MLWLRGIFADISNCSALEAGDEAGILGVFDLSGIDARELALELAREFGRQLAGTRANALDVRSRASSEMSDGALDVGIQLANCPLGSRGCIAE